MAEPPPAYDHGYPPPQQQPYNPGYPPPQQQPYYDHPRQAAYHDPVPQGGPGYHGYPPASYPKGQYGQQPRQAPKQPPPHYRRPPPPRVPASAYQRAPPVMQQQSSTNVVVVNQPSAPVYNHVIVREHREEVNHVLHLILTILFPPWIFIWLCVCMMYGC